MYRFVVCVHEIQTTEADFRIREDVGAETVVQRKQSAVVIGRVADVVLRIRRSVICPFEVIHIFKSVTEEHLRLVGRVEIKASYNSVGILRHTSAGIGGCIEVHQSEATEHGIYSRESEVIGSIGGEICLHIGRQSRQEAWRRNVSAQARIASYAQKFRAAEEK